jgi:hypothetical protein
MEKASDPYTVSPLFAFGRTTRDGGRHHQVRTERGQEHTMAGDVNATDVYDDDGHGADECGHASVFKLGHILDNAATQHYLMALIAGTILLELIMGVRGHINFGLSPAPSSSVYASFSPFSFILSFLSLSLPPSPPLPPSLTFHRNSM